MYEFLCAHTFSILFCIFLGVELLGYAVTDFRETAEVFPTLPAPFYISPIISNCTSVTVVSSHPWQQLLSVFFIIAICTGCEVVSHCPFFISKAFYTHKISRVLNIHSTSCVYQSSMYC